MDIRKLNPSELIRVAINDLKLCEADPRYAISMGEWHKPGYFKCSVCLAGAVMAQTLNAPLTSEVKPIDFDGHTYDVLTAVDLLRTGQVEQALYLITGYFIRWSSREITEHWKNRTQFEIDLLELADDLEYRGY